MGGRLGDTGPSLQSKQHVQRPWGRAMGALCVQGEHVQRLEAGDAAQEGDSGGRGQHLPPGLGAVLGCMVSPQFMFTGDLRM